MTKDKDPKELEQDFQEKSSKNASHLTEEDRIRTGKKVLETLENLRKKAQENGLTEDVLTEILDEYYDEKYGKDRIKKDN